MTLYKYTYTVYIVYSTVEFCWPKHFFVWLTLQRQGESSAVNRPGVVFTNKRSQPGVFTVYSH